MIRRIRAWMNPPVFYADELKTRQASLLNAALIVTVALALVMIAGDVLRGRTPLYLIAADAAAIVASLILRQWMRAGRWGQYDE